MPLPAAAARRCTLLSDLRVRCARSFDQPPEFWEEHSARKSRSFPGLARQSSGAPAIAALQRLGSDGLPKGTIEALQNSLTPEEMALVATHLPKLIGREMPAQEVVTATFGISRLLSAPATLAKHPSATARKAAAGAGAAGRQLRPKSPMTPALEVENPSSWRESLRAEPLYTMLSKQIAATPPPAEPTGPPLVLLNRCPRAPSSAVSPSRFSAECGVQRLRSLSSWRRS